MAVRRAYVSMKGVIVPAKKEKAVLDEKDAAACEVVKKLNRMKATFTTFTNVTELVMPVAPHVSSTLQKVSGAKGDTQERFHKLFGDGMRSGAKQRSDDSEHTPSVQKKQEQVEGKLGGAAEDDGIEFATDFEITDIGCLNLESAMAGFYFRLRRRGRATADVLMCLTYFLSNAHALKIKVRNAA
ncbi:hypothetical protein ERJ75_000503800 [Trypanosoma vivax]|nr:hypothetical protein ERJ75_000503800 [Trypanosoma vivax]